MGQRPRAKPEHLAAKLLAIRLKLEVSQTEMGRLLGFKKSFARVSEYETGFREPDLLVLLRYSQIAGVSMDILANDKRELPEKIRRRKLS